MNRFGKGISKYSSTGESNYLQGIAATYTLKNDGLYLLSIRFVNRMHE